MGVFFQDRVAYDDFFFLKCKQFDVFGPAPPDGIQVVGLGSLRGLADVKIPTLITFVSYWIVGLPLGYVLGFTFNLGVSGIWYGLSLGLTVAAAMLFFRFKNITKKQMEGN